MALDIRSLTIEDFEDWFILQKEAMPDPLSERGIQDEYQSSRSLRLGCWFGDKLMGVFLGWVVVDELQIIQIAAHQQARRRGIGKALLDRALVEACQRGVRRATLEVRESNAPAIALYRCHGFSADGIRRGFYADGESALLMSWNSATSPTDDG